VFQGQLDSCDLCLAARGKAGYRPMLDLAVFAEGIPKKVTSVSFAVRGVHIHYLYIGINTSICQEVWLNTGGYTFEAN